MLKWLSVVYAVRALFSDITFRTLTVRQTELGSLTFVRLRLLLTEQTRPFRFALVAFAPVRLSALNYKKTSADKSGSLFAIVDGRISEKCEAGLSENGFNVIKLFSDERLGEAVASHTDMLLFRLGNTLVGSRGYFERYPDVFEKIKDALPDFEFILSDENVSKEYPGDAIFNALRIGKTLFAKTDTVSGHVLDLAERCGLNIVSVKQGYPACTALAISDSLAITTDKGLALAMEKNRIRAIVIPESEKISLPPYKNGFIGGAASVFGDTAYFLGNLYAHPSAKSIEEALKSAGYKAVSLDPSADSLFDLGGMILINTDKNGSNISPKNPKSE